MYAGSSNWRGDRQRSDDMLLRIVNDGVYADYPGYWELIRSRARSDLPRPTTDLVAPTSVLRAMPAANTMGWSNADVRVRIVGSDGHLADRTQLHHQPRATDLAGNARTEVATCEVPHSQEDGG